MKTKVDLALYEIASHTRPSGHVTRDNKPFFILALTTVSPHMGSLVVSAKTKVELVMKMNCCHSEALHDSLLA